MDLLLRATSRNFAAPLLTRLREASIEARMLLVSDPPPSQHILRLPLLTPQKLSEAVLGLLAPLPVSLAYEPGLDYGILELAEIPFERDRIVRVVGREGPRLNAVAKLLNDLGVPTSIKPSTTVSHAILQHGPFANSQIGLMSWVATQHGVRLDQQASGEGLRSAAVLHLPDEFEALITYPAVRIHCGDKVVGESVERALRACGFDDVFVMRHSAGLARERFAISLPAALAAGHQPTWAIAADAVARELQRLGVDPCAMPLTTVPDEAVWPAEPDRHTIDIALPIDMLRTGHLVPWAGPSKRRFEVVVHATDPVIALEAATALEHAGFRAVAGAELTPATCPEACQIRGSEFLRYPVLVEEVNTALGRSGVTDLVLPSGTLAALTDTTLRNVLHVDLVRPGDVPGPEQKVLRELSGLNVTIIGSDSAQVRTLRRQLAEAAGIRVHRRPFDGEVTAPTIQFGCAPQRVIDALAHVAKTVLGAPLVCEQAWGSHDRDVWILVPPPLTLGHGGDSADPFGTWGCTEPNLRPFMELRPLSLRIGGVTLLRRQGLRHPLAPADAALQKICLDAQTAELLEHVAAAVVADEPCLLEGPTSATKTSGVLLLAALLGQPVLRLNLSNQVDTGELIGHWAPNPDGGFIWQDGAAVQAVTDGYWLILDEINLAPPQVLERLNSLLERPATLTVAERDQRLFGGAERPIHPQFRIFATMNPADYAGRQTLSPAGKDRWLRQLQVLAPSMAAIEAMLNHAMWGDQPELPQWLQTVAYHGEAVPAAACPIPADRPTLEDFSRRLADLYVCVVSSAQSPEGGLGSHRRDPYTFTRRGLLSLLERVRREVLAGVELHQALRMGLRQTFVNRVAHDERKALSLLMDAVGLGPRTWLVGQTPGPLEIEPATKEDDMDRAIAELLSDVALAS